MNIRSLLLFFLYYIIIPASVFAQNLFPERQIICDTVKFCMDCGTPKATCDSFTLATISENINRRYNFRNGSGSITFQVLVTPQGNSCVLSHTDVTHSPLTNELMISLNTCLWKPARENGIPVNASCNVVFSINYGRISGRMQRMDLTQLAPPDNAIVYNKQYKYANPSLSSYNFTIWTRYNSPLPDNVGQTCVVDKNDVLWYATAAGLTRFDGKMFNPVNEGNSPFTATAAIQAMGLDKDSNKWMYANNTVYENNDAGWQMFDSAHLNISKPYRIVGTASGEMMFPNSKGLLIFRAGKMRLIDNQAVWQLPSNNVYYAYYDSKSRLWIGTAKGSIMIDKRQKVTVFNKPNTPLYNAAITNVAEDEQGNLYFSLLACNKKPGDNDEEGLAVMAPDGKWAHYNDKNSGLPVNHINSILYDKFEHVLWIGTHQAGLVRFDLKNGWENYHNNNSAVPGPEIVQLAQDSKGSLYAATTNGMFRIIKK